MPLTLLGALVGAALVLLGVKKERVSLKVAGILVLAAIVIFWLLLMFNR